MNEVKNRVRLSSRREFVRQAASAAGGLALPYLIPSSVLAAPGRPGANDRVHVGMIATGHRANDLIDHLPPEGQVVAICDCDKQKTDTTLKAHPNARWPAYQDYRKMLDAEKLDAVIVATQPHWHVLPTIAACQAGKDVYLEKPVGNSIGEGRYVIEAAKKHDRIVQCGTQRRSQTSIGKTIDWIRKNYKRLRADRYVV